MGMIGYVRHIHWDDFKNGTSGSFDIPVEEWDACAGSRVCQDDLETRYKQEAIEAERVFWDALVSAKTLALVGTPSDPTPEGEQTSRQPKTASSFLRPFPRPLGVT